MEIRIYAFILNTQISSFSNLINTNDELTEINNFIEKIPIVNNVNHISVFPDNKISISIWNENTVDTPFKLGMVPYGNGFSINYSIGLNFKTQLSMAVGSTSIFTRACHNGTWTHWTEK